MSQKQEAEQENDTLHLGVVAKRFHTSFVLAGTPGVLTGLEFDRIDRIWYYLIMIDYTQDGILHINVYSKGKTELGRCLSNFAYSPFVCEDGAFDSIEGYWYWLLTDDARSEELRKVHGWKAKTLGRELQGFPKVDPLGDEFRIKIKEALHIKLNNDPELKEELYNTKLPLVHYYLYGTKVQESKSSGWVIDYLNSFRHEH